MARLQTYYREKVLPELMTSLGVSNPMQVPKITKISVNMGVGEAVADKKAMDGALSDLTALTGQKPVVTKSRKAIAAFKLRAGVPVGARVTLRGARMYEFLDRLINVAMPASATSAACRPARSTDVATTRSASRNRSSSRRSPTTRSTRSADGHHDHDDGTRRPGRPGTARVVQFPVPQVGQEQKMAKTSMIEREKRRMKLVKQHAAKRAKLKTPSATRSRRTKSARRRRASLRRSRAIPPRRGAQPLRDHRPFPRRLPQVRARAPKAARSHDAR